MSDSAREAINAIESDIAQGDMTAAQVFTQMKQLVQAALSANGGEAEPVGYLSHVTLKTLADGKPVKLYPVASDWVCEPVYTHPAPPSVAVPEGWSVRQVEDQGNAGFIVGSPRIDGVRTNTSVWLDDEDPAHQLLALMLSSAPQPDHSGDAGKVVTSNWKTSKHGQHWPHIGGKYLIKLNGVLQHEIYEFDQGDDGMGGGGYFWDREDLDEAAPFDDANDEWLPIDEAGMPVPSVPEEVLEALWRYTKGVDPETGQAWLTPRMLRESLSLQCRLRNDGDDEEEETHG